MEGWGKGARGGGGRASLSGNPTLCFPPPRQHSTKSALIHVDVPVHPLRMCLSEPPCLPSPPTSVQQLLQHPKQHVGVETALMGLIQDDDLYMSRQSAYHLDTQLQRRGQGCEGGALEVRGEWTQQRGRWGFGRRFGAATLEGGKGRNLRSGRRGKGTVNAHPAAWLQPVQSSHQGEAFY